MRLKLIYIKKLIKLCNFKISFNTQRKELSNQCQRSCKHARKNGMKIQLYFLLLFKSLDWLMKHFQREKCLAVWFFCAVPGRHKPCREGFVRKKDEFFTITVPAIQHFHCCWNPSARKAHSLVRTAVSQAQCLVKGKWSFPLYLHAERHGSKVLGKTKLQHKRFA